MNRITVQKLCIGDNRRRFYFKGKKYTVGVALSSWNKPKIYKYEIAAKWGLNLGPITVIKWSD